MSPITNLEQALACSSLLAMSVASAPRALAHEAPQNCYTVTICVFLIFTTWCGTETVFDGGGGSGGGEDDQID